MTWFCGAPKDEDLDDTFVLNVAERAVGDAWYEDPSMILCTSRPWVSDNEPHNFDLASPFEVQGLLQEQNLVTPLERDPCLADAQVVCCSDPEQLVPRAVTTPPIRLDVLLQAGYQSGQKVRVQGPHSTFDVTTPARALPGQKLSYFLGPRPEFEVTAPRDAKPGRPIIITTHDGSTIRVPCPEDCEPGETFHVEPPAIMVKVPDGVVAGRSVYFKDAVHGWLRATVPDELMAGGYFGARLPSPNAPTAFLSGSFKSVQEAPTFDLEDSFTM